MLRVLAKHAPKAPAYREAHNAKQIRSLPCSLKATRS
jgi:hypothetical protein